jgi:mRNA interferase MazF
MAAKTRPVVVVSRRDEEAPRALAIYVPLTTQGRGSRYEVEIPRLSFLRQASVANVQGLGSISLVRLERRLGRLPEPVLAAVRSAILFALDMG